MQAQLSSAGDVAIKACCSCGTDVANQPRMKDSHGKYWCMACGQADQRRKQAIATHLNCAACRQLFQKGKLTRDGNHFFCKTCLKKRTKAAAASQPVASQYGIPAAGASAVAAPRGERKRLLVMTSLLGALVIAWVLMTFVFTG